MDRCDGLVRLVHDVTRLAPNDFRCVSNLSDRVVVEASDARVQFEQLELFIDGHHDF